jgi:hypothetical protein
MAAITSIDATQSGAFAAAETALSSDDTITYDASKKQLLQLRNTTASPVVVTIDGSGGTSVSVDGLGAVSVASGLAISVPANTVRSVILSSIRYYCSGVVHLTGGTGVSAVVYNL